MNTRLEADAYLYEPKTPWFVVETPCYPCAFRVTSDYYRTDNSFIHFFKTREEAQHEADRRNAALGIFTRSPSETLQEDALQEMEGKPVISEREQKTLDALKNCMGMLDTPLARRQHGDDWFYQGIIAAGRRAIASYTDFDYDIDTNQETQREAHRRRGEK